MLTSYRNNGKNECVKNTKVWVANNYKMKVRDLSDMVRKGKGSWEIFSPFLLFNSCWNQSHLYLLATGWNILYQFMKAQRN